MPISSTTTNTTTRQQLAVAATITVKHPCGGQDASFSGYPSSTSRDAAAATWLAKQVEFCKKIR